jgi:glycosyltransferase involved in cell wall biosynthesis
MIFLVLPCNCNSGWGVCSTNLAKELSRKTKIRYVSSEFDNPGIAKNPIEFAYFKSCQFSNLEYLKNQTTYPIIQALQHDLSCYLGEFSGSTKIGITFADRKIPSSLINDSQKFNYIVSGSEWCKSILEKHNVKSKVILQGIDPLLFNKSRSKKHLFLEDFVIFSGGKFEHRKGQDITIKAYKVLQDKYPDVKLVCCWSNPYTDESGQKALIDSKIDLNRVVCVSGASNFCMPQIYQNTDIGIFPSRCEAGTNLVMMEYMACGKPVIATVGTGQKDLVNSLTGIPLEGSGICELYENNQMVSHWEEPNIDSAIDKLEWSYKNRSKLKAIASQASQLLSNYTWEAMANKFLELIP